MGNKWSEVYDGMDNRIFDVRIDTNNQKAQSMMSARHNYDVVGTYVLRPVTEALQERIEFLIFRSMRDLYGQVE